jgi:hypothetical protein
VYDSNCKTYSFAISVSFKVKVTLIAETFEDNRNNNKLLSEYWQYKSIPLIRNGTFMSSKAIWFLLIASHTNLFK